MSPVGTVRAGDGRTDNDQACNRPATPTSRMMSVQTRAEFRTSSRSSVNWMAAGGFANWAAWSRGSSEEARSMTTVLYIAARLRDGREIKTAEDFQQWVYEYIDRMELGLE